MKLTQLFIPVISALILTACQEEPEPLSFTQTQLFDIDHGVFNTNTYIDGPDAHSGKKFSRADIGNNYGFGYNYVLPDSLIGKDIAMDIDVWVRTGDITNGCEFVVSASSKDSIILWQGCGAPNAIKAANQWSNVISTVDIPSSLTSKPDFKITLLAHNGVAKSFFDVDDLKFTVYEKKTSK